MANGNDQTEMLRDFNGLPAAEQAKVISQLPQGHILRDFAGLPAEERQKVIGAKSAAVPAETSYSPTGFEDYGEPLQTAEGRAGQTEAIRGLFVGAGKAAARSVYSTPALEAKTPSEEVGAAALGTLAGAAAGVAAPGAIKSVLPSTARAGAALGEVKAAAGAVAIDTSKVGDTALEIYTQGQRGATLPKVVRDFVNRVTKPGSDPITYAEAKDFQSNVSRLSANERMNLNPNTQRLLGQLNADLKTSLESAADTVGKGEQFAQAMKEYHHAMQLRGFSEATKDLAWKVALGAAGLGGYYGIRKLVNQ